MKANEALIVNMGNDEANVSADLSVTMLDVKTELYGVEVGGYVSMITADDYDDTTEDAVTGMMVYGKTDIIGMDDALHFSTLSEPRHKRLRRHPAFGIPCEPRPNWLG